MPMEGNPIVVLREGARGLYGVLACSEIVGDCRSESAGAIISIYDFGQSLSGDTYHRDGAVDDISILFLCFGRRY
jgi:hypothetical protein